MTETQKFCCIVLATFIGGWLPCAMAGKPGVGVASGVMALLMQQATVWLAFGESEDEGDAP